MPDTFISRENVQTAAGPPGGLIPEEAANQILKEATESSAVMANARQLPRMSRQQSRIPVLSAKPNATWVNGDTGLKTPTNMEWKDVFVTAEEVAAIVPVPDTVLADSAFDIWNELRPELAEAIGVAFDTAVLYGTNKPASFPDGLLTQIADAGHAVTATGDLYSDLLDEDGVVALVEEDGYMVNGHLAALALRARLRGVRDDVGHPLFKSTFREGIQGSTAYELDGASISFPRNGALDPTESLLISGDWSKLVFAIRQDISYDVNNKGVITDANGDIQYNLWQQDMTALRVVFRVGWALPNPPNRINPDEETRFPFSALVPASG